MSANRRLKRNQVMRVRKHNRKLVAAYKRTNREQAAAAKDRDATVAAAQDVFRRDAAALTQEPVGASRPPGALLSHPTTAAHDLMVANQAAADTAAVQAAARQMAAMIGTH